jgi:hypothetical protein
MTIGFKKYFNCLDNLNNLLGSMINPISLKNRKLFPIQSYPGILHDYKIFFSKRGGMAGTQPIPGERGFHGVVHLFNSAEMKILDTIEGGYDRVQCNFSFYDGSEMEATVYTFKLLDKTPEEAYEEGPSTERYIDIICRGCLHFGVEQKYIDYLRNYPVTPRKKPAEFASFGVVPTGVTMSRAELAAQAGEGRELLAINGKVVEFLGPRSEAFVKIWSRYMGTDVTLSMALNLYEPLFPVPNSVEDMHPDHKGSIEDHMKGFVERYNRQYAVIASFEP